MKNVNEMIDDLRNSSRKLVRELGMLELNKENIQETPAHWHALIEISKEPGITISKLGRLLVLSVSTASRLVNSLTKKGLIKLLEGEDKREKYLHLTDKGCDMIKKIDAFSQDKIFGAFEYLTEEEIKQIIRSITKYSEALEKSRSVREQVKIVTISTSRTIRKQIIDMIENIQKNEFSIAIPDNINLCILKAEDEFYYNNSYNFWYAINSSGKIIGSIGLKKIDSQNGEIKKFFVIKEYRGKEVAQKLMRTLLIAAGKHKFDYLVLGSVDESVAAHKFYCKSGFTVISPKDLPKAFEKCPVDTVFFKASVKILQQQNS